MLGKTALAPPIVLHDYEVCENEKNAQMNSDSEKRRTLSPAEEKRINRNDCREKHEQA